VLNTKSLGSGLTKYGEKKMVREHIRTKVRIHGKQTLTAIALLMLFALSTFAAIMPAQAHVPAWNIPTYAYVTAVPSPVGVNQQVTIVFWLDKVPPTSAGFGGDRWQFSIAITKPDGTKDILGPFNSDPVGGSYTLYKPTQVGTYTLVCTFAGQTSKLNGPTGVPGTASDYINDTFLPSTATAKLVVQKDAIAAPPDYPLPTGYWTRPIEGENTNWEAVASNWLAGSQIVGKFQPNGVAPNSPHIMWTKPLIDGGVVGGSFAGASGITFYDGSQYENKWQNPIIMYGRLYYNVPQGDAVTGNGYVCVDLVTGEQVYWQNMTQPTFGQFFDYESMNQHGVIPNGYLWKSVTDAKNGGTVWMAYDPLDGNWLFNETNVPAGTQVYGPNGEILIFQMNYTGRWLACWNNTAAHDLTNAVATPNDFTSTNYYQWRPIGKNANASAAYSWNVTISDLAGQGAPAINKVFYNDILLGTAGSFGGMSATSALNPGGTVFAISLKPESRGQLLWIKNYTAPLGNLTRSLAQVDPVNRVFIMFDKETIQWSGYSIDTGTLLWGPTSSENPWNFYSGAGGALMTNTIAYGKLYSTGYSGMVYCYDTSTGKLLWNYSAPAGLATPYSGYPLGIAGVADKKLYLATNEHSSGAPYWKGAKLRCIDTNTGTEIWTMLAHGASSYGTYGYAIADGYLAFLNVYDNQIYCIGKGPSASSVTVSPKVAIQGSAVLIEGTVTDQTPTTKDTPAISDANMGNWMEYMHMQKPLPENAKGVNVSLTALDPNGNLQVIGTATGDIAGNFGITWTPPVQGTYQIKATFKGTESYGGSYATTYLTVGPKVAAIVVTPAPTQPSQPSASPTIAPTAAPASPSPSQAPQPTSAMPTTTYIAVGMAIVVIVAAAAALVIRRRK
jgi:outer membrane protein assembly factor BamB